MAFDRIRRTVLGESRPWWLLLALLALLTAARAGWGQAAAAPPPPQQEKFFDPSKLPFNTKVLREDTKHEFPDWPQDSATGATVKRLEGRKIGLPATRVPGVKFLKPGEAARLDLREMKSGLYIVGIDFVPPDLQRAIKEFGFHLLKDGTLLDKNRERVTALVTSELYMIEKTGESPSKEGSLDLGPHDLLADLAALFVPPVEGSHPFPWACYSFTPWAVYHGGFHRWYDARTWASSYTVDGSGGCSWASPLTYIAYISTRAAVGWPGNENHCFDCNSEYSRDVWDVGYFWPAHGIPTTTHTGVWADGSFSFSRSANLTW
jgi:hypothetical protein